VKSYFFDKLCRQGGFTFGDKQYWRRVAADKMICQGDVSCSPDRNALSPSAQVGGELSIPQ